MSLRDKTWLVPRFITTPVMIVPTLYIIVSVDTENEEKNND